MQLLSLLAALTSVCAPGGPVAATVPRAFIAVAESPAHPDTITVTVCVVRGARDGVASYRGELRLDTAVVRVLRVERGPAAGGMRVDNSTADGRVLFAGAAPRGFSNAVVMRVVLARRDRVHTPRLELVLRELSSTAGADLTASVHVTGYPAPAAH